MPLIGPVPAAALALARRNARVAVIAKWRAMNRQLLPAEQAQMEVEKEEADAAAILGFLVTSTVVVVASPTGPLPGTLT